MKNVLKKSVALLLCLSMMISMMAYASASNDTTEETSTGVTFEQVADEDSITPTVISEDAEEVAEEEDEIDPETQVRVIITFEEDSAIEAGFSTIDIASNTEALAYMDALEATQDAVLAVVADEINEGEALSINYHLTLAANAVSATVAYGDIAAIEAVEGVAAVYIETQYEICDDTNTTTAADMISSTSAWASGYTGAGTKVAIIDTGIDSDHQSFSSSAYEYSLSLLDDDSYTESWLTQDDVAAVLTLLNAYESYSGTLTASKLYVSSKIPYAYNYIDENLDITHDNDSQGDHGTHVSGIAAANAYISDGNGGYVSAAESVSTVGVAPDAQILVMKVFGSGGGAYDSDYVAAIEDAIILGADAVNLSLGSSMAGYITSSTAWIEAVFESLTETDTIVSISAGNSYYWSYYSNYGLNLTSDINMDTVGSPGSFTNALTVASADNTGSTGYTFTAAGISVVYTETTGYGNTEFATLDTSKDASGTEYEYVILAEGLTGDTTDLTGIDVSGKIVFIQRGTLSFYVKANNAFAAGAAAVVIYNNTTGSISMNLDGLSYKKPVVSILQSEGQAIIAASTENVSSAGNTYYTGTMTVYSTLSVSTSDDPTAATMSTFSSWGTTGDLSIKPEITAPGGSIYSTLTDGTYGVMSGTSMAAPSVTGMSALVLQYVKSNEALQAIIDANENITARTIAQSLLMATAVPLIDADSADGSEYSVRNQGSGLANVNAAVNSTAYIMVEGQDDGKVKAELGDDAEKTGVYTFSFDVVNFGDSALSYELDSSVLTADVYEYYGYLFMDTSDISLDSTTAFAVETVTNTEETPIYADYYWFDLDGDGEVTTADVTLLIKYISGKDGYSLDDLTDEQTALFDLNGDGKITTKDSSLMLSAVKSTTTYTATVLTTYSAISGYETETVTLVSYEDGILTIASGETATVTVTITLTEDGINFLETYYENGGYVEGYIYLNGQSDEEGAMAVDMSIPFLAFYGNWADSSMYEVNEFIELWYAEDYDYNYAASLYTNYYTLVSGGTSYYFLSNLYADDDEYIADRNAINATDSIGKVVFSLIRNAADITFTITDNTTGEVLSATDLGSAYAEFYYSSGSAWYYTQYSASVNWSAKGLADGTSVTLALNAYTEYTDEDGNYVSGAGTSLSLPLTVDLTAPTVTGAELDENGDLIVSVQDNRYVAAVQVYTADGTTMISATSPNQTEIGIESEVNVGDLSSYTASQGTSIYSIVVVDYAGNATTYRVKLDDSEEWASEATSITLSDTSIEIFKGSSTTLTATVLPTNLEDSSVTWTSSDESVATVSASGLVTGVAVGTATITATTVAYPYLTATCEVTVFTLNYDLSGVVWDEEGYVYWITTNSEDLSTWSSTYSSSKLSGAQSYAFLSATTATISSSSSGRPGGSSSTTYLLAATYNSDGTSDIYRCTPSSSSASWSTIGSTGTAPWVVDMTYATGNYAWGVYGYYILAINYSTGYYGAMNLGSYVTALTGDYITGIAYTGYAVSSGNTTYYVYIYTTESGDMYWFYASTSLSVGYSSTAVGNTGVEGNWIYDSLYADKSNGYYWYSQYDGSNTQNVYAVPFVNSGSYIEDILVPVTTYEIGSFATGVWPFALTSVAAGTSSGTNAFEIVDETGAIYLGELDTTDVTFVNFEDVMTVEVELLPEALELIG